MDASYIHQTPFLGPLEDPSYLEEYQEPAAAENGPITDYTSDPVGLSPQAARKEGAKISGRVISATTNYSEVLYRDHASGHIKLRTRRGLSSLYASISHLISGTDWKSVLVAWPGEIEGAEPTESLTDDEKTSISTELSLKCGAQVEPVWLRPSTHWRDYAEHVLWPCFHYIQSITEDDMDQRTDGYEYYHELNRAYADKIISIYRPGDIIWIHDFYLLLVPKMIRDKIPEAHVFLYIHSPFPSSEFIRCIPQRLDLLVGMLGSTMVGLQSMSYVRHFVSASTRIVGIEHQEHNLLMDGRLVGVVSLPIGIDTDFVAKEIDRQSVQKVASEIANLYKGKKLLVGRDKLDSVQGVIQKLRAFELFLLNFPEWRGKVVLVQITTPGYDTSPKIEKKVAKLISHINGTYGTIHFLPIQHFTRHIRQEEYLALMSLADLGIFTAVRDAASHAAFEFIACQRKHQAPVMLSEFMGIASLFKEAIKVNPYDAFHMAEAINFALNTDKKYDLYPEATHYKVQNWVDSVLSKLLRHELKHESTTSTPELDVQKLVNSYNAAQKRLFLFDYDGTLTPIVSDPAAAVPSERLKKILAGLCADPRNEVWIISGRDQKFLDQHLGVFQLSMSAEHGCFVLHKGEHKWEDLVAKMDNSWQKDVMEVLQNYTERTQGSNIERKKAALTWHYRRADPVFGAFQAGHLRAYLELTVASRYPVDVMAGKANVEVRPRLFNKGEIVRTIFKEADKEPGFVLCMGDDTTDEDMFRAVNDQDDRENYFSVVIGESSKLTVAKWHVQNPSLVHDALAALVDASDVKLDENAGKRPAATEAEDGIKKEEADFEQDEKYAKEDEKEVQVQKQDERKAETETEKYDEKLRKEENSLEEAERSYDMTAQWEHRKEVREAKEDHKKAVDRRDKEQVDGEVHRREEANNKEQAALKSQA